LIENDSSLTQRVFSKFLRPKLSVGSYVSLDEQSALEEKKGRKFGSLSQAGTVSIDIDANSQSLHN